jgi:GR25 family glycosyltransferase involved in LPS biosynthesis
MGEFSKSDFSVQIISTDGLIRSKNLEENLNFQHIPFKLSPGIIPSFSDYKDGKLHSKLFSNLICQRQISKAEVGCALAHKVAVQNHLGLASKFGIIFEDDAEILRNFDFKVLSDYLQSELPRILILGWVPGFAVAYPTKFQTNNEVSQVLVPPTCAFAYAFNNSAAKILATNKKILDFADWPIHVFNKINFSIVKEPWVSASQDPDLSTIGIRYIDSEPTKTSIFASRIRLIISLVLLVISSIFTNMNFSPRQILTRLFLKDHIYNFGVNAQRKAASENEVTAPTAFVSEYPDHKLRFLNFIGLVRIKDN